MKSILFIIAFFVFSGAQIQAAPDSTFLAANLLYQDGHYEESIELYESILHGGFESATLYYNLGNACFRSNKLGKARLYYEKCLKINPSDEDVQANLQFLEGLLADRFEVVPEIFFKQWFRSVITSRSADKWAYVSVFFFIASILFIIVYLMLRQMLWRKIGFYASILTLVVSLSSLTAAWKQYQHDVNPNTAVVTELSVNVKSAPRETGLGLFVLHEGAKVWLEDNTGGWQEIRLSDGRKGWLPEQSISPV